jgi:hypothetical protein
MKTLNTQHTVNYFSSLSRFCCDNRGVKKGTLNGINLLPKQIIAFLTDIFDNLKILYTSGKDSSCQPCAARLRSPVVAYSDLDLDRVAYVSEFIHLLDPYSNQSETPEQLIKPLDKDSWYILSLSSITGVPIINNYVCQAVDLATLIILNFNYTQPPVSEILAYRTDTLYDALILACSKPF